MGRLVAIACVVLSGCDGIFDLVPVTGDANGNSSDADGGACTAAVGHDEDADGIDDGCDVCPGISDREQNDADGDTIGDACDPRPAIAGDTLVKFMSFASDLDVGYWNLASGWTAATDEIVTAGGTTAFMYTPTKAPAFPFEVQMGMTFESVDRSVLNQVQLYGNDGATGMDDCYYYHVPPNEDALDTEPVSGQRLLPVTYVSATSFVARAGYTSTQLQCQLDGQTDAGQLFTATQIATRTHTVGGEIAIGVKNTKASLQWFAIYKLP